MSVPHSHPQARLAEHVRACRVGDQMIFLDLLRSRYIGISGPQLPALSTAILGQTTANEALSDRSNPALLEEWLHRLRNQHLLSDSATAEPEQDPPCLLEATAGLPVDDDGRVADFEWRHLARLWRAALITSAWLNRRSLAGIATGVAALRARHSQRGERLQTHTLHAATASYTRLRPFALTAHDRCLHDSLTLIHFLATEGLFPCWVIGVRVHPFGAHSWVQSGSIVLNDLPERVRHYRPILIV